MAEPLRFKSETAFRTWVARGWMHQRGAMGSDAAATRRWRPDRWYQWMELAGTSGWPDCYWARPDDTQPVRGLRKGVTETGYVEFKHIKGARSRFDYRVRIPWKPAQPVVQQWLARHALHTGTLTWIEPLASWLWLPAQRCASWLVSVNAPNGHLLWPHVLGRGRVPLPWELPWQQRDAPLPLHRASEHAKYMLDGTYVHSAAWDAATDSMLTLRRTTR